MSRTCVVSDWLLAQHSSRQNEVGECDFSSARTQRCCWLQDKRTHISCTSDAHRSEFNSRCQVCKVRHTATSDTYSLRKSCCGRRKTIPSLHQWRDWRLSTHADPTPIHGPKNVFWGFDPLNGEQSSPKWEISCPGRRWTSVQNLTPLVLSSPEKYVTVQTKTNS